MMIEHFKFKPILKIILSALIIAIVIVFSKFLPISNVFSLPFLRISLGPTILIFASLLLGPYYGAMVGLLSDLIGFIFDSTGYPYNPLFSLTYLLYGLVPGLLVYLLKKNKTKLPIIQFVIFLILDLFIILFFSLNDSISPYGGKEYILDLNTKIIVITCTIAVTLLYFVIYLILYKKFKTQEQRIVLNNISIINFVSLVFVQLFVGIIIKYITYQVDIMVLIGAQIIATLIEIFISNYLVCILYFSSKKIFRSFVEKSMLNNKRNEINSSKDNFKKVFIEELNKIDDDNRIGK